MFAPALDVADAQQDMRDAYAGGAPGMFASALVWLVVGLVAVQLPPQRAVVTLFVGGMLIHPAGVLIARALGRRGQHAHGNPLGLLALETTVWLVLSMPLAYVVSLYRLDLFFPAMLLVIAGRYATFGTVYGSRLFWLCGGALAAAAYALAAAKAAPATGAFSGAAIEAVFAGVVLARDGAGRAAGRGRIGARDRVV
jgi:hypothetical protein